jgi:branched-chain amino acid transport system permease protein
MSLVGQGALTAVESRRRTMWDLRIGSALVLILAVLIALPFGLTRYQVGLATEILIYGILAMSIDILAGFAGRTSLAHGALFGVSAYVVLYSVSPRLRPRPCSRWSQPAPPASISCC